jgi:hypothetical protein
MMCISVPSNFYTYSKLQKKAIHESSKMCMFCSWSVKNRWEGGGKNKIILYPNSINNSAYISWALFIHGANKWYFKPYWTKQLIRQNYLSPNITLVELKKVLLREAENILPENFQFFLLTYMLLFGELCISL